MARNVNREDFLVGQPPEMGQGDMDIGSYLRGARAELWKELRDQPLTMGGYYLLALWGDHGSEDPPRMRQLPAWPAGFWTMQA